MNEFQKHCLAATDQPGVGSVLIVEDDKRLTQCLARAMEARGFKVTIARSVCDGLTQIELSAPEYAVVDMRLDDGCGLDVVAAPFEGLATTSVLLGCHFQTRTGRSMFLTLMSPPS
jgi:ActR/RegA family two-component response regulator